MGTFTFSNQLPTSIDDQERLRSVLLACAPMRNRDERNTIIALVVDAIGMPAPAEVADPGMHVQALLTRCNDYFPQSISMLLRALGSFGLSNAVKTAIETFGAIYCHVFLDPQNGITSAHLSTLKQILDGVEFDLEQVRAAFDRSAEGKVIRPAAAINPEREFRALLWRLATTPTLRSGRLPLVGFVQELAQLAPAVTPQLRQWASALIQQLGVDPVKQQPALADHAHQDPCLQVVVEVDDQDADALADSDPITVSAQLWLNDTPADCRYFAKQATTLLDLPNAVKKLLKECQECHHDLTIEVFLPYALLKRYAVEEWSVKNPGFGANIYFRTSYPLVLRSSTRVEDSLLLEHWQQRWKQLQDLTPSPVLPVQALVWMGETDLPQCQQRYESIKREPTVVGVALLLDPGALTSAVEDDGQEIELLAQLIIQGLPLLLWPRTRLPDHDLQAYHAAIHASPPGRVPQTIRDLRKNDPRWRHIALLWDNPNRIPTYFNAKSEAPQRDRSS